MASSNKTVYGPAAFPYLSSFLLELEASAEAADSVPEEAAAVSAAELPASLFEQPPRTAAARIRPAVRVVLT